MPIVLPLDPGRPIDWSKTSDDYAEFRPGPPHSFYTRLAALGVGLEGQRILDLGTGTGVLAREFAKQGAQVSGIDIAHGQIEAAQRLAVESKLSVDFRVSAAENAPYPDAEFDAVTANQCWLYFDYERMIPELQRILKSDGVLVTSHFSWLPRLDKVARASEELILKHNPQWTAADWYGNVAPVQPSLEGRARLVGFFVYDEPVMFTRESWRGRMRACRGVGAALSPAEVAAFDREHAELLAKIAGPEFAILHRIDARIYRFA